MLGADTMRGMSAPTTEAIREAMEQEMTRDQRVFILGEDVGAYGGAFRVTQGFLEKFGPERIIDTPISETGLIGAAIGAKIAQPPAK